jgi:hypothetical protein
MRTSQPPILAASSATSGAINRGGISCRRAPTVAELRPPARDAGLLAIHSAHARGCLCQCLSGSGSRSVLDRIKWPVAFHPREDRVVEDRVERGVVGAYPGLDGRAASALGATARLMAADWVYVHAANYIPGAGADGPDHSRRRAPDRLRGGANLRRRAHRPRTERVAGTVARRRLPSGPPSPAHPSVISGLIFTGLGVVFLSSQGTAGLAGLLAPPSLDVWANTLQNALMRVQADFPDLAFLSVVAGAVVAVTAWRLHRARQPRPADPIQRPQQPATAGPTTAGPTTADRPRAGRAHSGFPDPSVR